MDVICNDRHFKIPIHIIRLGIHLEPYSWNYNIQKATSSRDDTRVDAGYTEAGNMRSRISEKLYRNANIKERLQTADRMFVVAVTETH